MKDKNKIALLLGSFGQTNIGDDLLMYNFLKVLVSKGYKKIFVNVSVKENIPREVSRDFGDLLTVFETYEITPFQLTRQLIESDIVLYGGGTILKDLYSSTGRGKHSVVLRIALFNTLAFILRKRVISLCIGIGSIRSLTGKLLSKLALVASEHTYFRDYKSYEYALKTLKIPPNKISYGTDGIFFGTNWGNDYSSQVENIPKNAKSVVGVNLLSDIPDWVDRKHYIKSVIQFLDQIMGDGFFIIFLPYQHAFNPTNDKIFMSEHIIPNLKNENYLLAQNVTLSNLAAYHESMNFFIGMRFHSLLYSMVSRTPFLAIEYDTKCTRLMDDMEYPFSVSLEGIAFTSLADTFSKMTTSNRNLSIEKFVKYQIQEEEKAKEILGKLKI